MAEAETPSADAGVKSFNVAAQYTKDLSFEAPSTPHVFSTMGTKTPDIGINVDVRAARLQERTYEVVLQINAECRTGDKVAFLLELVYGGLIAADLPDDELKAALLIEAPRFLFPFARNIVADVTRDAGFPPLMLSPVDFVQMYDKGAADLSAGSDD